MPRVVRYENGKKGFSERKLFQGDRDKRGHIWGQTMEERSEARIKMLLETTRPEFRDDARRYERSQRSRGRTLSTIDNSLLAIRDFASRNPGRTWRDITADDIARTLQSCTRTRSDASVYHYAIMIKAFLNWCYDDALPKHLKRALQRKAPPKAERRPITRDEFDRLLEATKQLQPRKLRVKAAALLWVLWDSGMRISEILSLRRESVIHEKSGGASLVMPADAQRLKTGPRTVFVLDCVPHLDAWMRDMPGKSPKTPLFPSRINPRRAMIAATATTLLNRITKRAGIRHVHAHLFRHTRATRAAEAGWNEFEMNAYFGWRPGSAMAAHYVHMNRLHLHDRVRREVAANRGSLATSTAPSGSDERLVALLREVLTELKARGYPRSTKAEAVSSV
jgi:integrase